MTVIQAPPARGEAESPAHQQSLGSAQVGWAACLCSQLPSTAPGRGPRGRTPAGLLPPCSVGGTEHQPDPRPSGVAGTGKNPRQTVRGPGSGLLKAPFNFFHFV